MTRVLVQILGRSHLDDLAEIHDRHAITHVLDDRQVVSDEEVREAEVPLEIPEKIDHLGLDGYIERRDRLIADDEIRLHGQRAGDTDALPLAATELVRITAGVLRV